MKGNLEPGKLALVVGCTTHTKNLGKVITLERLIQPDEQIKVDGVTYRARCDRAVWLVSGDGLHANLGGSIQPASQTLVAPPCLMPLDDHDQQVTEESDQELCHGH